MTATTYLEIVNAETQNDTALHALSDAIDALDFGARITLREELVSKGCRKLMPNLYYCYASQQWILTDTERARLAAKLV